MQEFAVPVNFPVWRKALSLLPRLAYNSSRAGLTDLSCVPAHQRSQCVLLEQKRL